LRCPAVAQTLLCAPVGEWEAAVRDYEQALETMNRTHTDEAGSAFVDAETQLLKTPAPNAQALAYKLEKIAEIADSCIIAPAGFRSLIADARRLA